MIILNDDNYDLIKLSFLNRIVKDYYSLLSPTSYYIYIKRPRFYYKEELRRLKELHYIEKYVRSQDFNLLYDIDGVKLLEVLKEKYKRGIKLYETNNASDLYNFYMGFM